MRTLSVSLCARLVVLGIVLLGTTASCSRARKEQEAQLAAQEAERQRLIEEKAKQEARLK